MNSVAVLGNHIATISVVLSTILFLSNGLSQAGTMTRNKRESKSTYVAYMHSHKGNGKFNLAIDEEGRVKGVLYKTPYAAMQLRIEHTRNGILRKNVYIKGNATDRFLCMNKHGALYSSFTLTDECRFHEHERASFKSFYSAKYPTDDMKRRRKHRRFRNKWYIALDKKRGTPVLGGRARSNQTRIYFVVNPIVPLETPFVFDDLFNRGAEESVQQTTPEVTSTITTTVAPPSTTVRPVPTITDFRNISDRINSLSNGNKLSQERVTGGKGRRKHHGAHKHGRRRHKNRPRKGDKRKHKRHRNAHRDLYKIIMDSVLT